MDDTVKDNHTYMEKYYPPFLRHYNRGGMTLVSPLIFEFGQLLLAKIRKMVTEVSISKMGRYALSIPFKQLKEDNDLKKKFITNIEEQFVQHKKFYNDLYHRILEATYNARIGKITKDYKTSRVGRYDD